MFLVRSIRRRLVTGLVITLVLMLFLAGAGVVGLIWHQEAVSDLSFLVYQSPNRDQLSRSISRVGEQLYAPLNLRFAQAVDEMRSAYRTRWIEADDELTEFRRRVEELPLTPELFQQRNQVLSRLDGIRYELQRLSGLAARLQPVSGPGDPQFIKLRADVHVAIARCQSLLDNLPAYEHRHWVSMSLEKQKTRSTRLLKIILWFAGGTAITFSVMTYCGFQWISRPLRFVARGATRIANGDFSHRLDPATRWRDEFQDLVDCVNSMAERFQEKEEDLQAKVRERSEQLARSQRLASVGFFAASVGHEINNPLSAISVAAESLEMRLPDMVPPDHPDAAEVRSRLAMIRTESRRCGTITRRLLDFARGDESLKSTTDLTEIIREVIALTVHLGIFRDRTILFERREPLTISMNASQIKQVVLNLVANGLQATMPGGTVTIELADQIDSVCITVSDDGCGMDVDCQQRIFDPFYSTRAEGQGTGLGLCITHRLVEEHHGTIVPFSAGPGKGSTFRVRLPKRQSIADAA